MRLRHAELEQRTLLSLATERQYAISCGPFSLTMWIQPSIPC